MLSREDLEALSPEFLEWLEEEEVCSSRMERLIYTFEVDESHFKMLLDWLYAAYLLGREG